MLFLSVVVYLNARGVVQGTRRAMHPCWQFYPLVCYFYSTIYGCEFDGPTRAERMSLSLMDDVGGGEAWLPAVADEFRVHVFLLWPTDAQVGDKRPSVRHVHGFGDDLGL